MHVHAKMIQVREGMQKYCMAQLSINLNTVVTFGGKFCELGVKNLTSKYKYASADFLFMYQKTTGINRS